MFDGGYTSTPQETPPPQPDLIPPLRLEDGTPCCLVCGDLATIADKWCSAKCRWLGENKYMPTQAEIGQRCDEIQATWGPTELRKRRVVALQSPRFELRGDGYRRRGRERFTD